MLNHPAHLGVAFLRGDPHKLGERLIMDATGGPFVHTEFFLQRGKDIRFYTAANLSQGERIGGFMPSCRLKAFPDPNRWEVVRFPISQACFFSTYAFVLQLLSLRLPYNERDLWQCSIRFLLPFERDLDCEQPVTWQKSGVFCSQVCLLLLRRTALRGWLPADLLAKMTRTNSRGCSPNGLHRLLAP
jgi:hypothetical protein